MSLTITTVIDHTRDDLRRADTTAGLCLVAIAGLAALAGELVDALPGPVLVALSTTALPAAATLVAAAGVLWPRRLFQHTVLPGSWLHAACASSWEQVALDYAELDPVACAVQQLRLLALITAAKYRWLRRATRLLAVTVVWLLAVFVFGAGRALW